MCLALWGLDKSGTFKTQDLPKKKSWLSILRLTKGDGSDVRENVLKDLINVKKSLASELEAVEIMQYNKRQIGKRLLFLFQRDLLPGISGSILESKGSRDFITMKQVSLLSKIVGWCAILALNIGMLFYIMLFALNQAPRRQQAWVNSFILWLIVEVLFISTSLVIVCQVLIPMIVMKDITKIKRRLLDQIKEYHKKALRDDNNDEEISETELFNAANYLFVSTRLAKGELSYLKESKIIAQFSTPWPKQSYQRAQDVSKTYSRKFSALTKSGSIILVFLISNLLNAPPSLQDMIMQIIATFTIGYTVLVHIQLFNIFPLLVVVPTLIVGIIAHFWYQSGKANRKLRLAKLIPINISEKKHANNNEQKKSELTIAAVTQLAQVNSDSNSYNEVGINEKDNFPSRKQSIQQGVDIVRRLHEVQQLKLASVIHEQEQEEHSDDNNSISDEDSTEQSKNDGEEENSEASNDNSDSSFGSVLDFLDDDNSKSMESFSDDSLSTTDLNAYLAQVESEIIYSKSNNNSDKYQHGNSKSIQKSDPVIDNEIVLQDPSVSYSTSPIKSEELHRSLSISSNNKPVIVSATVTNKSGFFTENNIANEDSSDDSKSFSSYDFDSIDDNNEEQRN